MHVEEIQMRQLIFRNFFSYELLREFTRPFSLSKCMNEMPAEISFVH